MEEISLSNIAMNCYPPPTTLNTSLSPGGISACSPLLILRSHYVSEDLFVSCSPPRLRRTGVVVSDSRARTGGGAPPLVSSLLFKIAGDDKVGEYNLYCTWLEGYFREL